MPQTSHHSLADNSLRLRLADRVRIEHAMAFLKFSKSGRVQQILHALKYKNQPEVGVVLGKVYGDKIRRAGLVQADLILPVPLHISRLRTRGYNQSSKFAEGLSAKLDIPFSDEALVRTMRTETQTRKTKLSRWQNVSEVFHVKNSAMIKGRRVLLADDVITTGATIEACANVLLKNGCSAVSVVCIAEA